MDLLIKNAGQKFFQNFSGKNYMAEDEVWICQGVDLHDEFVRAFGTRTDMNIVHQEDLILAMDFNFFIAPELEVKLHECWNYILKKYDRLAIIDLTLSETYEKFIFIRFRIIKKS